MIIIHKRVHYKTYLSIKFLDIDCSKWNDDIPMLPILVLSPVDLFGYLSMHVGKYVWQPSIPQYFCARDLNLLVLIIYSCYSNTATFLLSFILHWSA